jgi:phosphate transport system permease protein
VLRLLTEKHKDRVAGAVIRVGGVLVILVVVAIVVDIGLEAVPLFLGATAGPVEEVAAASDAVLVGTDPRREIVWSLDREGLITLHGGESAPPLRVLAEDERVVAVDHEIHGLVVVLSSTGQVIAGQVRFRDEWHSGQRRTQVRFRSAAEPCRLRGRGPWAGVTANASGDGDLVLAARSVDGSLELARWWAEDEEWEHLPAPALGAVHQVAVAEELDSLAVVESGGGLRIFRLPALDEVAVEGLDGPVAAVRYVIGGGTLLVGGRDGRVGVMLLVPRVRVGNGGHGSLRLNGVRLGPGDEVLLPDDQIGARLAGNASVEVSPAPPVCRLVRELEPMSATPSVIAPSHRRRGFAVGSEDGSVALYHATSGRRLLADRWDQGRVDALAIAPKADGLVALVRGQLLTRWVRNPHPEVSLRTLFLPVWYEGYAAPKWVWQSTGGTDAFEPKLSLWPLLFGTLKATLYAMLISVPLALLAAIYVSQLAPSWVQSTVKPTLELMAAVPSVVVGFLAALWLAPRLETHLFPVLLALLGLPLGVILSLLVWRLMPAGLRRRLPSGSELGVVLLCTAAAMAAVSLLSGPLEGLLFGGDFKRFLFTEWGLRYDQRNSLVVGLGLGFAVIPVIFTIAEDACSAVPRSLVNAARALGATPWQTAIRLVVPAASPGLFAAMMLGFGRAVGETMIVLMAAGNTPLLELSPFNGMRTMSAAIAVEIPEAPVGGTLFRVLFLTGALLFLFTLVLTTAADVVGSYLRRRYGRF